ncbi:hypothetical protein [Mesorhizobium xinjiangense]|uniref:hypothetical protein n=1 Tax=Mesorhizobium xinjiangense TaxID=2678685 RepID=UPI0012ED9AE0|nr:hypothetical protein [Mesorhizobium xinjiangense]
MAVLARYAALLLLAPALAACNSTESVLGTVDGSSAAAASTPATQLGTTSGNTAPARVSGRIRFAPVVGTTVEAATPLSRRLKDSALQRGLSIANGDAAADYLMKGYFSAFSEGNGTMVIFVWDVLDPSGNRLHRIQGQEKVARTAPNAWDAVPQETMESIADATVNQLAGWLGSRSG